MSLDPCIAGVKVSNSANAELTGHELLVADEVKIGGEVVHFRGRSRACQSASP